MNGYCMVLSSAFDAISHKVWKPIFPPAGYSGGMTTSTSPHKKVFRFCVENDAAIATLEGALAIIRRLGIDLCSLRTSAGEQGMEVQVRLAAAEEEPLVLCRMRLHNVVGILGIREMPVLVASRERQQKLA
ncbi:MAG: hypothetical protein V4462_00125 [Pseudomonadota bacterium]